jgi:hypothetical protein
MEQAADRTADRVLRMAQPSGPASGAVPAALPHHAATSAAPSVVQNVLSASGRPLDPSARAMFEPRFGRSFAHVRVHEGEQAARSAQAINALAFTYGRHIVFNAGRYDASSTDGRRLIAHELAHVVQQAESGPSIQRMAPCPDLLRDNQPTPRGWQSYHGNASWFHCGFRGILEDRTPTPDDPQNECFYDHSGALVDENHRYAGCRGTPNQYDSATDTWDHVFNDTGGIAAQGAPAFVTSRIYDLAPAIAIVQGMGHIVRSVVNELGTAIALAIYTATATVDPGNWSFQGLPARSIRHLNVMGAILRSAALAQNAETLLINLTRRLDSFPIPELLTEIAQDVNQALRARDATAQLVTASGLGLLSLVHLVEFLRVQGLLQYNQPPEQLARQRYAADRAATPPAQR